MRNRPTPIFDNGSARGGGSAFDVDAEPGVRLWWLFVAMTLPLLVVAGRLIYLQGFVAEGFAVETQHEAESFEAIPARNGRIVATDGTVLAFDDERYRLLVHYRWLEDPPNERWLRDEALARLSRSERRDKGRVEQAKADVLARRETLWQSLAELTEVHPDKLAARRDDIQKRVERIHRLVEERASLVRSASTEHREPEDLSLARRVNPAQRAWDVVKHELTTTPTRERHDPLRIAEQSDYHLLLDDVSREVVAEIETQPEQYPGVRTDLDSRRVYPHGRVAPHLVGYRGEIDADELKARHERFPNGDPLDYQPGDSVGRTGIEKSYEHILRGVRGQRKIVRDRHGTVVRNEVVVPPKPGRDVVLNLSVALQERATKLLEEAVEPADVSVENVPRGGCLVAIDVQTGAVLTAAVAPTFDVNDFLSGSDDVRQALNDDPRRPMFPRVTQMKLPPGSVFKTVSAVAVLESHRIDPDHQFECVGYLKDPKKLRCYTFSHFGHGHYGTDLTKAIAQSCNVYFFNAAQTLGPQPLVQWADEFGFGERTGIDLPGEIRGHVPRPPEPPTKSRSKAKIELASHERQSDGDDALRPASPWESDAEPSSSARSASAKREPWYAGDTLGLAIGQSRLTATPLQIARMMAAVANDGWLITPHVAREISAGFDEASVASTTIELNRHRLHDLSDGTLARVREGLEQVVAHPQGTGFKTVRMKELAIAGKTGTAEIGNGKPDHAWFAGYVPADRPRIAFVVVLEQAGSGGKVAGPVAKKFVQLLLEHGLVSGE
jgi:penicillin-binding protein 2